MILSAKTKAGDTEIVVFEWSTQWGHCYECGLPAAFRLSHLSSQRGGDRDENGVAASEKRCAVCAANAAVDGEHIARIQPPEDY